MDAIAAFFILGFGFTLGAFAALVFLVAIVAAGLGALSYMLRQKGW